MSVITVNGEINANKLGVTDVHEHIFCDYSKDFEEPSESLKKFLFRQKIPLEKKITLENFGILMRNPLVSKYNQILSNVGDAKEELTIFKDTGIKTIVDPTNIGVGRNPSALKKLSNLLDINIITATGYYRNKFHPPKVQEMSIEEIEEEMAEETEIGIDDTGIRAGVIGELGTSEIIYPNEKKILIAGARVNKKTNVPIMVHTEGKKELVMEALKILSKNGANLEKVNICHVNGADYFEGILKIGAYVGLDCFGSTFNIDSQLQFFDSDLKRIKNLLRIINKGYVKKVIIGNDICMKMRLHKYGGWGYDHILTNLLPYMKNEGIDDEQLRILLIENPKNFLDMER